MIKKKTEMQKLEIKADNWFSKFIRLRDCDEFGYVICCTCGKRVFWKEADNGHFVLRDRQQTRYHDKNCNPQCTHCNMYKHGEQFIHGQFIDKRYGEGTAELLRGTGRMHLQRTKWDYEALIKIYKEKVKQLLKEKGL